MLELLVFAFLFFFAINNVTCSFFLEFARILVEMGWMYVSPVLAPLVEELGARFFDYTVMPVMTFPYPLDLVQLVSSDGVSFAMFAAVLLCIIVLEHRKLYFSPLPPSPSPSPPPSPSIIDAEYLLIDGKTLNVDEFVDTDSAFLFRRRQ